MNELPPTPQTDALNRNLKAACRDEYVYSEMLAFAQMLERQRNEMRDAIREAHAALDGCREDTCELFAENDWWKDEHRCDYSTRWAEMKSRITKADVALDKLQPFLK
jgi:hypothetical protein